MTHAEALALLRLARTDGIGPLTWRRLLARHRSGTVALAGLPEWGARRGTPFAPPSLAEIEREWDALAKLGGRFVFADRPGYPPLLALLDDPPPALAVLGDAEAFVPRAVAVVGARNASAAGRRMAELLAEELVAAGIAVVSGLARGIDAAAHGATLGAKGRTIAAVAGGLDQPFPPEHAALQARIAAEGGAVVAESPLGTAPLARHFPRRNRVIAGLSLGVVVVEAAPRSGSLLTARLALEAGRELFAVPGSPLDPRCRGGNDLIRQGATLTEGAADVLAHLPDAPRPVQLLPARPAPARAQEATEAEPDPADPAAQLLSLLGPTPVAVDSLARQCHLPASALGALLLDLELAGRVELLPGNRVALTGRT